MSFKSRSESIVHEGTNQITGSVPIHPTPRNPVNKVNSAVFQEVSVGGFPHFMFKCGAERKDVPLDFDQLRARLKPEAEEGTTFTVPVLSYELKFTIPYQMRCHQSLLPAHEKGLPAADFSDRYEAILLTVLDRPQLDKDGPQFEEEMLGLKHFCTNVVARGSGSASLNCHQFVQAASLAEIGDDNKGKASNYICASLPLRDHFQMYVDDTKRLKETDFYRYFKPYLHPTEFEDTPKSYGDRVYLIGTYLPNLTVVWFPVFQEDHKRVDEILKSIERDTVISSDVLFYVDTLDIFLTRPGELIDYLEREHSNAEEE